MGCYRTVQPNTDLVTFSYSSPQGLTKVCFLEGNRFFNSIHEAQFIKSLSKTEAAYKALLIKSVYITWVVTWQFNQTPLTARKTIFSFSIRPEKMVFPKKLRWNMIFLVLSGKMIFLFPKNMILHVRRKMKDDLS